MKRSTFIKTMGLAGLAVGLPRFATFAQASIYAKTAPPIFEDYALNPVRQCLGAYTPPTEYAPEKSQKLTFQALSFQPKRRNHPNNIHKTGHLILKRTVETNRIRYDIVQELEGAQIEGFFICQPDAFRTPIEWELTARPSGVWDHRELAALVNYRGTVSQNSCRCQAGALDQTFSLNHKASLFYNLLDAGKALQTLPEKQQFDVFWEGLAPRPNQTLDDDGYTVFPGSNMAVKTVMLHGPAMMPQHFLVAEDGTPLGVTGFMTSWMLTRVEDLV